MTPAEEDALIKECCPFEGFRPKWADIRLAIRAAVAQERERAAKVCEELVCRVPGPTPIGLFSSVSQCRYHNRAVKACAAAIRRGE